MISHEPPYSPIKISVNCSVCHKGEVWIIIRRGFSAEDQKKEYDGPTWANEEDAQEAAIEMNAAYIRGWDDCYRELVVGRMRLSNIYIKDLE